MVVRDGGLSRVEREELARLRGYESSLAGAERSGAVDAAWYWRDRICEVLKYNPRLRGVKGE